MKKIANILLLIVLVGTSCSKFLDINNNPNQATSSSPSLLLPQTIVTTASISNQYNTYGAQLGGYMANAYGVGGFGNSFSYTFSGSDYSGLWANTFDLLNDLKIIRDSTAGSVQFAYYNAVATILSVYNYQLLVDTYNNIPFTSSLKGKKNISPTYDDAKTIYPALSNLLDSAVKTINSAVPPDGTVNSATSLTTSLDPLFGGDLSNWKRFANTIKLRLIIRAGQAITMPSTTFSTEGFLTTDAVVNPGYGRNSVGSGTQVNPSFNSWVATYSGGKGNRSWVPSKFAFAFYAQGQKLFDSSRGRTVYYNYDAGTTGTSQLGVLTSGGTPNGNTNNWYDGAFINGGSNQAAGTTLTTVGNTIGVFKGPDMGQPLLLAAESYLLQAEANVRGIASVSGTALSNFENGVIASFNYLYKLPNGALALSYKKSAAGVVIPLSPTNDFATYKANNPTSYLVNFALATTTAQKIEAIITQKYIAVNMINSNEGWNEYRRTGYPISDGSTSATRSFASTQSQATTADKLPGRIQYPITEFQYNAANVPTINPLTDKIFWAR